MGLLNFSFNSGPPDQTQQRMAFLQDAFALSPADQTYSNILALAKKYSAQNPVEAAEDFYSKQKEQLNLLKLNRQQRLEAQQEEEITRLTQPITSRQLPYNFSEPDLSPSLGPIRADNSMLGRYNLSTSSPPTLEDISGVNPAIDPAQFDAFLGSLSPAAINAFHRQIFSEPPASLNLNTQFTEPKDLVPYTRPAPLAALGIPPDFLPLVSAEYLTKGSSPLFDKLVSAQTQQPNKESLYLRAARGDQDALKATLLMQNEAQKPVNLPPILDTFLTLKYGSGYTHGSREEQASYVNTLKDPATRKEFELQAPKIAAMMASPFYSVVPTEQGLVKFNARQGETPPVITGYKKPLSSEQQDVIGFLGTVKDSLNEVKNLFNAYPNATGPATGIYGETAGRFLPTPNGYEDIRSALSRLQDIVYPKSGKQINETELKNLYKTIPLMTDKEETRRAKLNQFEEVLNSLLKRKIEAFKAGGSGINSETGKQQEEPISIEEFTRQLLNEKMKREKGNK